MRKVCGVGINDMSIAYSRWSGMLHRCYNKSSSGYLHYGAKGVYVCEEWLTFSNFYMWFIENYIEGYEIDKDIKGVLDEKGNKYYSPESCMFVSSEDNQNERLSRCKKTSEQVIKKQVMESPRGISKYQTYPITKSNFRCRCKKYGENYHDFIPVFSGYWSHNHKLYYFVHKAFMKSYFYYEKAPKK